MIVMKELKIESIENNKIKYFKKIITNFSFAKKEELFVVETQKLINEICFNSNVEIVYNLYLNSSKFINSCLNNILITPKIYSTLSSLTTKNEQICFVKIKSSKIDVNSKLLVLDNIQDPGNVGALIRSAKAFGFDNILSLNSATFYNPKVIRSAKGNLFNINFETMSLQEGINFLKNNNFNIIGTNLHGKNIENNQQSFEKVALILGNEGQGMSDELILICHENFKIETNFVESLNVAIAGSILMYEINKGVK